MRFFKSFDLEKIGYQALAEPANPQAHLIIVPGFGGDINFLTKFTTAVAAYQPKLAIYALCPRGHAFSSMVFPEEAQSIEAAHAQDLLSLINHLQPPELILVGHSYGGVIIQTYLNLPNATLPKKFFLICSTPRMFGLKILRRLAWRILTRWQPSKKPFAYQAPAFYERFAQSWDLDWYRWRYDTTVVGGLRAWFLQFLATGGWHNSNLKNLNQDSGYYLYGKRDIIIPRVWQKFYLKDLPNLHQLELNAGHLPPITNPIECASQIAKNI